MASRRGRRILRKLGKPPKWRNWSVNETVTERAKVAPGANWGGAGHRQKAVASLSEDNSGYGKSPGDGTCKLSAGDSPFPPLGRQHLQKI